jgi:hypothetical protein
MERPTDYEICVLRIHRSKHGEKSPPEGHGAPCYGRGLITSSQKLRLRISRKGKYEGGWKGCGCKGWVVAGPAHNHVYEQECYPVPGSVPIHIPAGHLPLPPTTSPAHHQPPAHSRQCNCQGTCPPTHPAQVITGNRPCATRPGRGSCPT